MTILRLLPAALSLLLLGAHFLRAGTLLLALVSVAVAGLLVVPRPWAARAVQAVLVVGALEWLRTLALLVAARHEAGLPYARLSAILAAVAAFTLVSAALVGRRRAARAISPPARGPALAP